MTVLQVVNAMERVYRETVHTNHNYDSDTLRRRLGLLVSWSISLGRYGAADFQHTVRNSLTGCSGDTAVSVLEDLQRQLQVRSFEAMIDLCKQG